jgi:two-component system nitrate/nitrite sensor histidine kinase NarX
VARHAEARNVGLVLTHHDSIVTAIVEDDGRGFDPELVPPSHLGLGIMRERAETIGAMLSIDSEPGAGTHIDVTWQPLAPATAAQLPDQAAVPLA